MSNKVNLNPGNLVRIDALPDRRHVEITEHRPEIFSIPTWLLFYPDPCPPTTPPAANAPPPPSFDLVVEDFRQVILRNPVVV